MSKLPSFQFYPGDWSVNQKLKRCSHEEKGVWIDVLCLFHDSDEYGVLRWPLEEIAHAVGTSLPILHSLLRKGVLKGKPKDTFGISNGVSNGGTPDEHAMQKSHHHSPKDTFGISNGASFGVSNGLSSGLPLVYVPFHAGKKGDPVVLLEDDGGDIWFSSRMVVDNYKRQLRAKQGIKSFNNPNVPRPKQPTVSPSVTKNDSPKVSKGVSSGGSSVGSPSSSSTSFINPNLSQTRQSMPMVLFRGHHGVEKSECG
jgi:hypothetical protein